MKILALDSSGIVASVAIVQEDVLLAEYTVNYKKTHSQTLLPMLDEVARMTELDLTEIDAIATAAGPGSFTGLRIGSATAKGLGLALQKPLIAVPTVEALAYNLYDTKGLVCPIMDARRNQVYTGIYRYEGHRLVTVKTQTAMAVDELLDELNTLGEEVTFLGDGVPVFKAAIEEKLKVPSSFAPPRWRLLGFSIIKKERYRLPRNTNPIICGFLRQSGSVPRGKSCDGQRNAGGRPVPGNGNRNRAVWR